ncbi:MAG: hypothetical protein P8N11_12610 [Gammaproteobacteria bacterium]|jgi:hypothetical protein|nr:hypothetical protein [Gammaproteobacteria bacterium]
MPSGIDKKIKEAEDRVSESIPALYSNGRGRETQGVPDTQFERCGVAVPQVSAIRH